MSDLKSRIQEDMKTAMKAKEAERLGTIRMLLAAMKQKEVDERIVLSDADILAILNKMIKQRRESAEQFAAAHRPELADKEKREIEILTAYLPAQLSEAEIDALIKTVIQEVNAKGLQDIGKVMATLKNRISGKADLSIVSAKVKEKLG